MRRTAAAGLLALIIGLTACSGEAPSGSASPIPSAGAATVSPVPSASATVAPETSPSPTASVGTTHVVARGEGLMAIARAYGTSVDQLVAWNVERYPSLAADRNLLEPGWVLLVSGDPGVTPLPPASPLPATPASTPPPAGSDCTAGNRVAAGSAQTFRTIPDAGSGVALTFDMGGRMEPAIDIMEFLVANDVCATVFATGVMSDTPQGREVLAIIRAHPELFEIANHTMFHCDLVRGGGGSPSTQPCAGGPPSADRIRQELTDAEAILRAGTGQAPQPYWRPPYGSISQAVLDAAASVGYTKTFLWDVDTVDWKPVAEGGPTADQIAASVVGNAVNGSNVLFHLGGYETLDSLRLIVPGLRDRGFTLTSLSELLD
jgi:peptidoglycan/xylan/chitin deacetylase (PgdA/CDA1 family)